MHLVHLVFIHYDAALAKTITTQNDVLDIT
jgi:hypothetical protein